MLPLLTYCNVYSTVTEHVQIRKRPARAIDIRLGSMDRAAILVVIVQFIRVGL